MKALLIALPLLASGLIQDSADLSWKPKVNDSDKYHLVMTSVIDMGGTPSELVVQMDITDKVISVVEDVVTMEEQISNFKILFGGQDVSEMGGGGEMEIPKMTYKYKLDGSLVSVTGGDTGSQSERAAQMSQFMRPKGEVKVGASWEHTFKANKEKGMPEAKVKYTLEGEDTVDGVKTWKIKAVYSEMTGTAPFGSVGTVWLEQGTGDLVQAKSEVTNVIYQEGAPPMNGTVVMTRVKK